MQNELLPKSRKFRTSELRTPRYYNAPVVGKFCVPQRQERPHTAGATLSQNQNNPSNSQPVNAKIESLPNDGRINPQNGKRPSLISTKKGQQINSPPMKNEQMRNGSAPPLQSTHVNLPAIAAYQRHELTLLRMEDLLNNGSGSQSALPSEYNLDFVLRIESGKREN